MNQEKVGKFIAKCRKEKNMTQQELADRLGITDKAISKWENGRSMPDIGFLEPLSVILEIDISEIIKGEHIEKENLEKVNPVVEDIIDSVNESNQDKRKKLNDWIKLGLITYVVFAIENQFNLLSYLSNTNVQEFIKGALIGLVLYFYLMAFLENNKYINKIKKFKKSIGLKGF